ncbi:Glycoprotein-N-acetylgalactosamine 3-beta-galactosyltransferase 1 [Pleurostoma richardsiae]|uniref:N-acetylgalactosaminide beta-1,3-galactosyltransferase n=1 Tax=Pleurostoma richardsiae TaxID=41990 RepID=A0AA38RDC6_9PEZI|nr:Glycoprotein-N-acetylgalactosamine 3-beta-galactosyltransferase 1 [Pleurostoma richardsiae]
MLSRRSFTILSFAFVSIVVLALTSRRLGDWSFSDGPYYRHGHDRPPGGPRPPPPPPPPPGGPNGTGPPYGDAPWDPGFVPGNDDLPPRPNHDPMCESFPDTSNILLVMKTGATESFDRIPTQIMTVLKCLPDFLIFSDMEQRIGGYHIHDSLETVLEEAKEGNSDFDLYRRQKACPVDQVNCQKLGDPASEGWNLDKYKNIHIAEKAYRMRPGYDWYVFIDADTYVLWPNMVQWLRQMRPSKKRYLGSVTLINDFSFGHGGSGYVVSRAAMEESVGKNPGIANKYDVRAKSECCGDYLFALAVKETSKISVEQVWPTINGEKPNTLPFGPTHWCHPIVTMHHMNSEEISSFWDFERRRYAAQNMPSAPLPLTIKDIYTEFLAPKLVAKREDWDNLSDDWYYLDASSPNHEWEDWRVGRAKKDEDKSALEKRAHLSFDDCRRACESVGDCFQFRWQDECCGMSRAFMLGKPVKKESKPKKRSMSGWDVQKIQKWVAEQGECSSIDWPAVS